MFKKFTKHKSFFFFLILNVFSIGNVNAQEKLMEPVAVFSAVFLEKYNSESFSYAPWGNEKESNATIEEISIGSSSMSRKFVYYGDGKVNFYNKRRPREWETEDQNNSIRQPMGVLSAEFELPQGKSGTQEFFLLFVNKKKNGLWRIYPIPFSKNEVPVGSYQFISQSRTPLYVIFGKEKFSLPPSKTKVSPAVLEEGKRGVLLQVMIQKNAQYLEVFNQRFGHSPIMRGIFFLGLEGRKLKVKKVAELSQSLSSATGYGKPRFQTDDKEDSGLE